MAKNRKRKSKKHFLKRLALWPLKPKAALEALMQVDPAKVRREMHKLLNNRSGERALPTG